MRGHTSTALATALVTACLSPLALSAPASAVLTKHYDDFNGDGYRDVAYLGYNRDGHVGGAVNVVYGTAHGLDVSYHRNVDRDSAGVPGTGEEDDMFDESIASADLNKDGYADLVVGNPVEHVGSSR